MALSKVVAESYDFVIDGLKSLTEEQMEQQVILRSGIAQTRAQRLSDSYEHQTHHRGQTALYLRLKGVVPPAEPF